MNRKVRGLIEKLGEAIHETVAESEQIAGVVRNIRAEGFEVVLMLEATIGLDEVEASATEPAAVLPQANAEGPAALPFTTQDLHFLRSLRIRLNEDSESDAAD